MTSTNTVITRARALVEEIRNDSSLHPEHGCYHCGDFPKRLIACVEELCGALMGECEGTKTEKTVDDVLDDLESTLNAFGQRASGNMVLLTDDVTLLAFNIRRFITKHRSREGKK